MRERYRRLSELTLELTRVVMLSHDLKPEIHRMLDQMAEAVMEQQRRTEMRWCCIGWRALQWIIGLMTSTVALSVPV